MSSDRSGCRKNRVRTVRPRSRMLCLGSDPESAWRGPLRRPSPARHRSNACIRDRVVLTSPGRMPDLYFRSGLIKQKLNAADIVDRSFSGAIGKGAGL